MTKDYRILKESISGLDKYKTIQAVIAPALRAWANGDVSLDGMTPGQKHLLSTYIMSAELFNGGIDQFFINSSGSLAHEALEGFRGVGAHQHAELIQQIYSLFPNGQIPKSSEARALTVGRFPEDEYDARREDFDNKFYDLMDTDTAEDNMIEYLHNHPEEFFVDP